MLKNLLTLYTRANHFGIDCVEKRERVKLLIHGTYNGDLCMEIRALVKVLFCFMSATVSKEFKYQPFQSTDLEEWPELPPFMEHAVKEHRKRNGDSSIF